MTGCGTAVPDREFTRLWARYDVQSAPMLTETFHHRQVGDITVDCDSLALADGDQHPVLYTAPPGSRDADSLALLDMLRRESFTTA